MAGRRIVDAAKLFHASKCVARKHIALRSSQWDAYSKTSTLAKAVKNQTDRVTLTAAAAIALSQRFGEEAPAYARAAAQRATGAQHQDVARQETPRADCATTTTGAKDGLDQDHHYDRSVENTATQAPPGGELEVQQEDALRRPLPDGTIPTAGPTLEQQHKAHDTHGPPKAPLTEGDGRSSHTSGDGLRPTKSSAQSTIPLLHQPVAEPRQAASTIPSHANDIQHTHNSSHVEKLHEGHDRDVFYSRSVESQSPVFSQSTSNIPAHAGTQQGGDEHVEDGQLNQDVFYTPSAEANRQWTQVNRKPVEDKVPEGINTDVFHSRKVARMLGSDPFSRKELAERQSTWRHPLDDRPFPKSGGRHPLDDRQLPRIDTPSSPSVRPVTKPAPAASPAQPRYDAHSASTAKEMENIASQLAQDVQSNTEAASKVGPQHTSS